MLTILLVLVLFAVLFGGWGYPRYGAVGFGPVGLLLVVLLILYLTGALA